MAYAYRIDHSWNTHGTNATVAGACADFSVDLAARPPLVDGTGWHSYMVGTDCLINWDGAGGPYGTTVTTTGSADSGGGEAGGTYISCAASCTVTHAYTVAIAPLSPASAGITGSGIAEVTGWGVGVVLALYLIGFGVAVAFGVIRRI